MNTQLLTGGGTAFLADGSTYAVTSFVVESPSPQRIEGDVPKQSWVFTDQAGHEHRWYKPLGESKEELPTLDLRYEHIDCDNSCGNWDCDGYDRAVYSCKQCGEQVEPEYRRGTISISSGPAEWRVNLATHDAQPFNERTAATLAWVQSGIKSQIQGELIPSGTWERCDDVTELEAVFVPERERQ